MKNTEILKVVIKSFIYVCKQRGHYVAFVSQLRNDIGLRSNRLSTETRTKDLKNFDYLFDLLCKLVSKGGMVEIHNQHELIGCATNMLLHTFMENLSLGVETLASMGEDIYNIASKKVFGEDFVEKEEDILDIKDPGQVKAKIFQDYIRLMRDGEINISFEEYYQSKNDDIEAWIKKYKHAFDDGINEIGEERLREFFMDFGLPHR